MEPIAVVIIMTGVALLLLVLRAGAREGEEVIERLVDGAERELRAAIAARTDREAAEAELARVVAQLNTLGFLMLAVERRGCGRAISARLGPELEARVRSVARLLSAGRPVEAEVAALADLESELIRAAVQGLPDAAQEDSGPADERLASGSATESDRHAGAAAEDVEPAPAATSRPAMVPDEAARHRAETKIWPQVVEGCLGVERIFQAFQPEQQRDRVVSLAESVSLLFQGLAPSLVLGLAAGREVCGTLAQPLERLGATIGQELLVVHTLSDLAARTTDEEASRFAALARAARGRLEAGLQRLHGVRRGLDRRAWQASAEEIQGAIQAEVEATASDCQALLAMVPASEHLTVQEMMLAHPRGPALVRSLGLKCPGCVAAEVETLASAALVHDIPVEQWILGLGGAPSADEDQTATAEALIVESPSAESPIAESPSAESPSAESPRAESSIVESPSAETPIVEIPSAESPSAESPSAESPSAESPSAESPSAESPSAESSIVESPSAETPIVEIPRAESSIVESPSAESPSAESPTAESPTAAEVGEPAESAAGDGPAEAPEASERAGEGGSSEPGAAPQ